jgi:hypothetical protein
MLKDQIIQKPDDMNLKTFYEKVDTWPTRLEDKEKGRAICFRIFNPKLLKEKP